MEPRYKTNNKTDIFLGCEGAQDVWISEDKKHIILSSGSVAPSSYPVLFCKVCMPTSDCRNAYNLAVRKGLIEHDYVPSEIPRYGDEFGRIFLGTHEEYDLWFSKNILVKWDGNYCFFKLSYCRTSEEPCLKKSIMLAVDKGLIQAEPDPKPRYKHDISDDVFLGQAGLIDLWFNIKDNCIRTRHHDNHCSCWDVQDAKIMKYESYITKGYKLAVEKGLIQAEPRYKDNFVAKENSVDTTIDNLREIKKTIKQCDCSVQCFINIVEQIKSVADNFGGLNKVVEAAKILQELSVQ